MLTFKFPLPFLAKWLTEWWWNITTPVEYVVDIDEGLVPIRTFEHDGGGIQCCWRMHGTIYQCSKYFDDGRWSDGPDISDYVKLPLIARILSIGAKKNPTISQQDKDFLESIGRSTNIPVKLLRPSS